jgi:hypothetical protein
LNRHHGLDLGPGYIVRRMDRPSHKGGVMSIFSSRLYRYTKGIAALYSHSQCSGSVTFLDGSGSLDLYTGLRIWIRILLFSSVTIEIPTKIIFSSKFLCLLVIVGTFTSVFKDKKSQQLKLKFFLFFYVDGRIWIQIQLRTSNYGSGSLGPKKSGTLVTVQIHGLCHPVWGEGGLNMYIWCNTLTLAMLLGRCTIPGTRVPYSHDDYNSEEQVASRCSMFVSAFITLAGGLSVRSTSF